MPERRTRREALAAGLAGAAALALAAPARGAGADEGDALTALIRAEQDAAFAYREASLPDGALLAAQDEEHAKALASHVEALAMHAPGPTRGREDLGPATLAVLDATGAGERLRAAVALERGLIEGCADRLAALEEPNTVRTVATVMAGHAQHLAHLEAISGR